MASRSRFLEMIHLCRLISRDGQVEVAKISVFQRVLSPFLSSEYPLIDFRVLSLFLSPTQTFYSTRGNGERLPTNTSSAKHRADQATTPPPMSGPLLHAPALTVAASLLDPPSLWPQLRSGLSIKREIREHKTLQSHSVIQLPLHHLVGMCYT